MPKPIILLEFNELCPNLMDRWMASGELPNFKRLHDASFVTRTMADEQEAPNLEPWIQWYSMHTGKPFSEHKVFHLTDGPKAGPTDIWTLLAQQGLRVWNCSSMNAKGFSRPGSAFLPDPWCTTERAFPAELNTFHEFVSMQVREYSNASKKDKLAGAAKFVAFMVSHGLSFATVSATIKQLAGEKLRNGESKWQRVAIADCLLLDVFLHYHRKIKPDFSTFFINSTAHLQHSYWRQMDPDSFTVKPSEDEVRRYGSAVFFGYKKMDQLLGRLLGYAAGRYRLGFATALSQQPFLKYEDIGGQRFYRPHNIEKLLDRLRVKPLEVLPVMTHQYSARFANAQEAARAKELMVGIHVSGKPLFGFTETAEDLLYFGCQLRTAVEPSAVLINAHGDQIGGFTEYFYQIEAMKSGRHHPEGYFWMQSDGPHQVAYKQHSILDVYPALAAYYGVTPSKGQVGALTWA